MGYCETNLMLIAPSFLGFNGNVLYSYLTALISAGASVIHVDCMDGHFVNQTYDGLAELPVIATIAHMQGATVDLHLLVDEPNIYLPSINKSLADRVSIHIESGVDYREIVTTLHLKNIDCGLAIKSDTKIYACDLTGVDYLHVATALSAGSKPPPLPHILNAINTLRRTLDYNLPVMLDGGITSNHLAACIEANIDIVVMGSALFRETDPVNAFVKVNNLAKSRGANL
jgi:ribulose-phosphate 3-epimerase